MTSTPLPDGVAAELVSLALSDPGQPNLHLLSLVKQDLVARLPLQTAADAFAQLCGTNALRIRRLPLVSMRDYLRDAGLSFREVISVPRSFFIREPKILGVNERGSIEAVGRTIFIGAVEEAIVRHRSSLVETGGLLLLDTQGDEAEAIRIGFGYDPHVLEGTNEAITLLEPIAAAPSQHMTEAIHLGGVTSYAFGHWLGEYIIKLFGALRAGLLLRVPILIDAGMPASHREALSLFLAGDDFPIIEISQGSTVTVDKLWVLSSWMYAPYFPLPGQDLGPKRLSPPAQELAGVLRWMRLRLPRSEPGDAKLFLRRRADQHRHMTNDSSIEKLAVALGFTLHDLEGYCFAEQLKLADGATSIAGPDGSALTLAVFIPSGGKVTILNHTFLEAVSPLAAVLEELGHDVLVVQGRCVRKDENYLRLSDYEISEGEFREAVSR